MRKSIKKGFGFGITSGIITTLGLMIGLYSGTHSKMVVLAGILTIAVADAMSDALGMHLSEEAESKHNTPQEIWESTISTFLFKFIFAAIFILPIIILPLNQAIIFSVLFGMLMLGIFSYRIAKTNGTKPFNAVFEHLLIALVVIVVTYLVGKWSLVLG